LLRHVTEIQIDEMVRKILNLKYRTDKCIHRNVYNCT